MGNFYNTDFATIEEGFKKLREAVSLRDKMSGAVYYGALEEDSLRIADHLSAMGADKKEIAQIGGWELRS